MNKLLSYIFNWYIVFFLDNERIGKFVMKLDILNNLYFFFLL